MNIRKKDKDGLFKNIFVAYFILLLHVFLLAGIGLTVVLFQGIYHYLPWIMAGIAILVLSIVWVIYARMKETSASLGQVLGAPQFQDRAVEIRLLGGLASFEIKAKEHPRLANPTGLSPYSDVQLIESPGDREERRLLELNGLYDKELITKEEFEKARQDIIQS
ncbi:SHOCT domain-containing protein [uncultured Desulfobacter sp.]|uniref:SHOCT domain-containing protein n=1 Tax=uncultured Desulfobacter sp. TaxID=240139 RepID=UPI002AAB7C00|nr:SHOCT domain-containing protein [uncultured Desulfobacter sp.]